MTTEADSISDPAHTSDPTPPEGRIRRLPEHVVNRIAAGEVVGRPSAALKELIENSLDAGAKSIVVSAREGGLKLLQVIDDGKGIPLEDLPLLCERFATSKISTYEDLESVSTFGFRGEALASMSHVGRLSVLTKLHHSTVAYRAAYSDSALKAPPEPTAGVDGTTLTIEDMFYNLTTRRRALKSSSEEYRLIADVVTRYAIQYPHVSFVCKREQGAVGARGKAAADVRTEGGSTAQTIIRTVFGPALANETISLQLDIENAGAVVAAIVSSANFSMKKGQFILFINGRLVDCQPFKRAVWSAYSAFLPKQGHPFVYISLKMRQEDVDVNVHPAKKEVRFLHERLIVDEVVAMLISKLKGAETSRTFLTQSVLVKNAPSQPPRPASQGSLALALTQPGSKEGAQVNAEWESDDIVMLDSGEVLRSDRRSSSRGSGIGNDVINSDSEEVVDIDNGEVVFDQISEEKPTRKRSKQSYFGSAHSRLTSSRPSSASKTLYSKDKVRTGSDAPVGLYDVFLKRSSEAESVARIQSARKRQPGSIPLLTSVENLLNQSKRGCHKGLAQILKEHQFVGVASSKYVLMQHGTKLLLADTDQLLEQLMYQQALTKFGDLETFRLDPPAPIQMLLDCYLTYLPDSTENRVDSECCVTVLQEKRSMLLEYFGISITGDSVETAMVDRLPMLFPGAIPDMTFLGEFVYRLAAETDWSSEECCFRDIALRIGGFYGNHWEPTPSTDEKNKQDKTGDELKGDELKGDELKGDELKGDELKGDESKGDESKGDESKGEEERREWMLRHVFFAALRNEFWPPRHFFTDKVIREITSTCRLYKVFERC